MLSKILQHKLIAGIILLLIIAGGYFGYQWLFGSKSTTQYVTAQVEKGTLIVSITGSGQVSVSNQIDVKAKTSGDVVYVGVKNGQEVKSGTLLVQLDMRDAQKTVRDAEISLETAKLSLEKLENSTQSEDDQLKKAYDDGLNESAKTHTDISPVLESLNGILFDTSITDNLGTAHKENNIEYYVDIVDIYDSSLNTVPSRIKDSYNDAKTFYNQSFAEYKTVNRNSASSSIENVIKDTYTLTKKVSDIIKTATDVIQFFKDKSIQENWSFSQMATVDQHLSNLTQYATTVNSHLSNLFNVVQTITNNQIDVRSQKLTVEQKEDALLDAQEKLADYFICAPFDGVVANIDIKNGDSVSAGTAIATLITKQRIAEISLNEVDVAKIKIGQKATLIFDAVPDLNITGEVTEIDILGTVTQGVVTYNVKIVFDTQDERVKPGMSVSAAIVTDAKQDVLLVPNSAVKSNGNGQYVEILVNNLPQSQSVETGLSNDTMTEILNGLQEGEQVITQTITANSTNTSQTQSQNRNTGLRIPGL